jgi:hypothetical protein
MEIACGAVFDRLARLPTLGTGRGTVPRLSRLGR